MNKPIVSEKYDMKPMSTLVVERFRILGVSVVFIFLFIGCFYLIRTMMQELTALSDFSSAFAGALFGYLAIRFTDIFKDLKARQTLNIRSLVILEHLNMQAIDKIGTAKFIAEDWLKSFSKAKSESIIVLNFNKFREIPVSRDPLIDLLNLDLMNDVAEYFSVVERVNDSMYSLETYYETMVQAAANANVNSYITNLDTLIEKTSEVLLFVEDLNREAIEIQSKIKVISEDASKSLLLNAVRFSKNIHHYSNSQQDRVATEIPRLTKEIEENGLRDRERIKEIVSHI